MNKMTTVALAGLVAVSSLASASMSRVNGFGKSATFISDVTDIWSIPGVIVDNKDATYFELGHSNNGNVWDGTANNVETKPWGGVHASLGGGVLGLWVNRPADEFNNLINASSFTSAAWAAYSLGAYDIENLLGLSTSPPPIGFTTREIMTLTAPGARFDILYGMALNDQVDLAIGLNRASFNFSTSDTLNPTTNKTSFANNSTGVLLGAGIKGVGPISKLNLGLGFQTQSFLFQNENTVTDKTSADASGFNVRIAGNLSADKNSISAFDVQYSSKSLGLKDTLDASTAVNANEEKLSASMYSVGYAMGMSNEKGMGLASLILTGDSTSVDNSAAGVTNKVDSSSMTLDLATAGEAKLKDWLVARAGLSGKIYGSTNNKTDVTSVSKTETSKEYPADATVSTGLSVLLGDITLDGVFNRDFLYTGPYLLSGSGENVINTQVSATWAWGGGKE